MSTTQRIPSPLARFVCLPQRNSLVLLTGVQDAGSTWLLLRYLSAGLGGAGGAAGTNGLQDADISNGQGDGASLETSVLLVSWMRDFEFWRAEAKRAMGINLARLQHQGRFAFVDGVTGIFASSSAPLPGSLPTLGRPPAATRLSLSAASSPSTLSSSASSRYPQPSSQTHIHPQQGASQVIQPDGTSTSGNLSVPLSDYSVASLERSINEALEALTTRPTVLLLDAPSAMIFLGSPNPSSTVNGDSCVATARGLLGLLMRLRSLDQIHALVMTLPADAPLLAASPLSSFNSAAGYSHDAGGRNISEDDRNSHPTSLDAESAAFTVGAAHQADLVLACRPLATGWAEDVSGVVRATFGGNGSAETASVGGHDVCEWLYFVERDGSVRIWERGGGV